MRFDSRAFRDALGVFPTGVCVVTTNAGDAGCIGVTVSSFNSVSLDPPLILWSLGRTSALLPVFRTSGAFIVNVLPAGCDDLAMRFASRENRAIAEQESAFIPGFGARLNASLATFDCVTHDAVEAGDHIIFIGRVTEFNIAQKAHALGFFGGKFCTIAA